MGSGLEGGQQQSGGASQQYPQAPQYSQGPSAMPPQAPYQPQGPSATPVPGIPIKAPVVPPAPGQVITHYDIYQPQAGCCMCDGMKQSGFIAIILLLLFFWPLAWIPCVMDECFEQQQRPVYGYAPGSSAQQYQQPNQAPSQQSSIPVAEPVKGEPVNYPTATQPPV